MNTPRLISALAVVGSIACATAPTAASAATTEGQAASSANWSGYVAGGSSSGGSTQFSSVSGSWVEPSANCNAGQGYSAFWVGLGGSGQGPNALEQTGTEADCGSDGSSSHFAWYELVPAAPVEAGPEHLSRRSHHRQGHSQRFQRHGDAVRRHDRSVGHQESANEQPRRLQRRVDRGGAVQLREWIPVTVQPLPLTDFGKVSFTNSSATRQWSHGHDL